MPSKRRGGEPVMHFQNQDGFNPNDSVYKACCCHSKTFTIFIGIFEIFTICFLLVAVLPDVTTRICDKLNNGTEIERDFDDITLENLRNVTYVSVFLCNNNITCLIWAIIQVMSVIAMFYGIKTIRYWFFLPHFIFRIVCLIIICLIETWIVIRITGVHEEPAPYITTIIVLAVVGLCALYATKRRLPALRSTNHEAYMVNENHPPGPGNPNETNNH
ncbi:hypothetical protein CAEBREN_25129 [Caenorhabditis brenneri]|uniref:Uncharacterized protein n=1 Tax=Caenorhabditis brenneri TaxID=135651 RepID=G0MGS7_CAEBE|nr:hypothetical protein CAEBREN_25129 [Caenorhabditis brenneri]